MYPDESGKLFCPSAENIAFSPSLSFLALVLGICDHDDRGAGFTI